jgi:hypothetical protein
MVHMSVPGGPDRVADEKDVNRVRINNLMTRRRQEVCTRRGAGLYRRARKIRRTAAALLQ